MRVLGIDPGLHVTGYGLIEVRNGNPARLLEAGLIRTEQKEPVSRRLRVIAEEIQRLIAHDRPDWVAVEDLYSYYKTPKPAILIGHVRGVVLGTADLMGVPVASYLPTRVKRAVVGQGHASKRQIARLVQMRLHLTEKDVPADVTDALAVALCHADHRRAG